MTFGKVTFCEIAIAGEMTIGDLTFSKTLFTKMAFSKTLRNQLISTGRKPCNYPLFYPLPAHFELEKLSCTLPVATYPYFTGVRRLFSHET